MLWLILIFLIFMAVPAVLIAAKNQNAAMDVLAMHENLKRNHPDDALSQVGPHEFQRAFHLAKKKRGQKVVGRGFLWYFLGLIISIPIASFMFFMDNDTLGVLALAIAPLGFGWYGAKSAQSKMPELFDQMRAELLL